MMREVVIFLFCISAISAWTELKSRQSLGLGLEPGPLVLATKGEVWPKPQKVTRFPEILVINPKDFSFVVTGKKCLILDSAILRYEKILIAFNRHLKRSKKLMGKRQKSRDSKNTLTRLQVNLSLDCEYLPYLHMNEEYTLNVNSPLLEGDAEIKSDSIWGILRGLETFVQLIYLADNGTELLVRSSAIADYPRFPHRGLHLDTARHYMPPQLITDILEGMAINKFNVFHWHIVDDQSFPYESKIWPELSQRGAYSPLHVYTPEIVAMIIEFARVRGIRVIPEFDTPGHTRSWGIAYPELLTECYNADGTPDGSLGPMHPLRTFTYTFMSALLKELVDVFPDPQIHLGGDEVPFDCWLSNPEIWKYLNDTVMTPEGLEQIYIEQVINMTKSLNATPIVWQEVFDNGVTIPPDTVVHVWKDWVDYMGVMSNVTRAGYSAILSSCWYLDHLTSGGDWRKFYSCDPTFFPASEEAHQRVLGGEACMWAEVADRTNVMTRIWPRASAAAERLWSSQSVVDIEEAATRLEEHACRMNLRGIATQPPNGPGFCPFQL